VASIDSIDIKTAIVAVEKQLHEDAHASAAMKSARVAVAGCREVIVGCGVGSIVATVASRRPVIRTASAKRVWSVRARRVGSPIVTAPR